MTASTSLKHALSILLPQISAMLPSPNSEWSVKTALIPSVLACIIVSIPSALRAAWAWTMSIDSRTRMDRIHGNEVKKLGRVACTCVGGSGRTGT